MDITLLNINKEKQNAAYVNKNKNLNKSDENILTIETNMACNTDNIKQCSIQ